MCFRPGGAYQRFQHAVGRTDSTFINLLALDDQSASHHVLAWQWIQ
jgi:hypothetical protein